MRTAVARALPVLTAALLGAAGCGEKEPPRAAEGTPEYRAWRGAQFVRQFAAAAGAPTVAARLEVLAPAERSPGPGDFCELYLNGEMLLRFRTARLPDGAWPRWESEVRPRAGPNCLDLWDSTTNRNYRRQVDLREGTDLVFAPTADGYEIRQSRRE